MLSEAFNCHVSDVKYTQLQLSIYRILVAIVYKKKEFITLSIVRYFFMQSTCACSYRVFHQRTISYPLDWSSILNNSVTFAASISNEMTVISPTAFSRCPTIRRRYQSAVRVISRNDVHVRHRVACAFAAPKTRSPVINCRRGINDPDTAHL